VRYHGYDALLRCPRHDLVHGRPHPRHEGWLTLFAGQRFPGPVDFPGGAHFGKAGHDLVGGKTVERPEVVFFEAIVEPDR